MNSRIRHPSAPAPISRLEIQREIGYLLARVFLNPDVHRCESRERSLSGFPNVFNEIVFLRIPAVPVSTHEFVQFLLHGHFGRASKTDSSR
jgi:hypothetical protein